MSRKMKQIFAMLLLILSLQNCITIREFSVNEREFLGNAQNDPAIYTQKSDQQIINPFSMNTDNWGVGPIDRFVLVELDDNDLYRCFELQIVKKDVSEEAIAILYHADTKVADVYYTSGLKLNEKMYENILNQAVLTETDFDFSLLEDNGCLKSHLELTDRFGNEIKSSINEEKVVSEYSNFLAPIGGESDEPDFMSIVYMKKFRFLARENVTIQTSINDKSCKIQKFPVKINGVKGYNTKYTMEPVIASWNMEFSGELTPVSIKNESVVVIDNAGNYEIKKFVGMQGNHNIQFSFSPAIPDLINLKNQSDIKGKFSLAIDEISGIIAGHYTITKWNNQIKMTIKPTEGWSPIPGKAWMKKMEWNAAIELDNKITMNSIWKKI